MRPPGPQFLNDLDLEDSSDPDPPSPAVHKLRTKLPPMARRSPVRVPVSYLTTMLPYCEHTAPMAAAAAALIRQPVPIGFLDRDAIASLDNFRVTHSVHLSTNRSSLLAFRWP
jgi:hypothetical protein